MNEAPKLNLKHDISSSFVVFLVSMPLCLGIALASGAPTISGIFGGIIGAVVVGFLGGAPFLITGPANGLLVISWELIHENGFSLFLWAVLLAGIMQILAGTLKLGQFFRAVTPGVILGLMTGFAVVIFSGQLLGLIGAEPAGSVFGNFGSFFKGLHQLSVQGYSDTFLLGSFTLLLLFGYDFLIPKKFRLIPAALVAMFTSTVVAYFYGLDVAKIDIPSEIFSSIKTLDLSHANTLFSPVVIKAAMIIAFIASAETLLSATAVDKLHRGPRTHYNRELTAQGIGNTLCGIFGGIPITGVIIRSTANVTAGARSKWSNIFSGLWLLLFVAAFPTLLMQIPKTVLAAVLIHSVVKLVRTKDIKHLWEYDRFAIAVYITTTIGVVFFNVLTGVAAGIVLSTLHSLQALSRTMVQIKSDGKKTILALEGAATFFRIPQIATALEDIDAESDVVIDYEHLLMIDFAVYTLLQEWEDQHVAMGGNLTPRVHELVEKLPYVAMRPEGIKAPE